MTNPFDDDNGRFLVLRNDEHRHCLWPAFATVPPGWTVAHEEDSRQRCLDYVEEHWTELRPSALAVAAAPTQGQPTQGAPTQGERAC